MNAVANRAPTAGAVIPSNLSLPPIPSAIDAYERAAAAHAATRARWQAATPEQRESMVVGPAPQRVALNDAERRQAMACAASLHSISGPVTLAALRTWLGPVNAAVRNPQSLEDFAQRCFSLHALLDDLPGAAFTAEARKTLPGFFPSAADIRQAVEPGARKILASIAAVNAAMAFEPKELEEAPTIRGPRTMEELAYAAEAMKQIKANLSGLNSAVPADLPPVKPRYLSEGHLLAQLDKIAREGGPCAGASKLRADAIRARARQQVTA